MTSVEISRTKSACALSSVENHSTGDASAGCFGAGLFGHAR